MEEKSLPIVIVGHIDHGKSTLVGRLFYDTGCLPPDKYEDIKRICESMGKEMEFAFVMDNLQEEREGAMTIDIAHTFFKTDKRRYVIIDAPGHKEFLKNMITGSSQAEAALLLLDISRGIQDQTKRHSYILNLIGIKQTAVLINKMDMVDYSEEAFTKTKKEIERVLTDLKITSKYILPISAKMGENVAKKSDKLSWFKGPTVLEALDSFSSKRIEDRGLRFPVQDIYEVDGQSIAVGRVESGIMRQGEDIYVLPEKKKAKLKEIRKFMQDNLKEAVTEDCVGICVEGLKLSRGQVVVDKINSLITNSIHANIFWIIDKDYKLGIPLVCKCATQESKAKIEKIYQRFDSASIDVVEKNAKEIKPAEIAEVEIKIEKPFVVDKFNDIPETGRFVLEHDGHPVAGGIIL